MKLKTIKNVAFFLFSATHNLRFTSSLLVESVNECEPRGYEEPIVINQVVIISLLYVWVLGVRLHLLCESEVIVLYLNIIQSKFSPFSLIRHSVS